MLLRSNGGYDIHPMHQSSTHEVVERIRIVGKHHFRHDGHGILGKLLVRHIG
jgi:hypothetical protein